MVSFSLFAWHLENPFRNYCIQKTKMSISNNDSFAGWNQRMVTIVNLKKLHTDLAWFRLIYLTSYLFIYLQVDKVDLILSRADIFETPKDIDDFTNCPTHRSNLGVGWSRGSSSRCRVPKEVSGHGKGRVKSIPKADRGIGKRVSQIVLKMSGKFVQSGFGK